MVGTNDPLYTRKDAATIRGYGDGCLGKKLKVYLDTSVISALFDKRDPVRKRITEGFFDRISDFEIFISRITINEIKDARSNILRRKMMDAINDFEVLAVSNEVISLGQEYISNGALPSHCPDDAYHIAAAVLNDIGHLLSWNFQHIVRTRTRKIVRGVNRSRGLPQLIILTPREV
jgi:predicted nucleic acid-binding protein